LPCNSPRAAGHRRYGLHDLLRRYARDHAVGLSGSELAVERLLDYYQYTAVRADALIAFHTRPGPPLAVPAGLLAAPDLDDGDRALAWVRTERASLLACLDGTTRAGQHARMIALTAGIAGLLRFDGPWADAISRCTAAARAASHIGDRLGQANALTHLGSVRWRMGDYLGAAQAAKQALAIYRDLGDRTGQANALFYLGTTLQSTGDFPAGAQALEQAMEIYRDLGDRTGQGAALVDLGVVRRRTGDYRGAAGALEQALHIFRDLGSRIAEASALNETGTLYAMRREFTRAEQCYQQALELARAMFSAWDEARALAELGRCALANGHLTQAEVLLRRALEIFQRIGAAEARDLLAEVNALAGPRPAG
jgi:tetratricopeptide (TPR) repeat protein